MAGVVEWALVPCTAGMPLNDCGLKATAVENDFTLTTPDGTTVVVTQGTSVAVSGSGIVSHSASADNAVNFASAANGPDTTSSIGPSGSGSGGGGGGPGGGGGNNSPPGNTPPPTFTLTGLALTNISPASTSVSP